jgi:hypothetical protein
MSLEGGRNWFVKVSFVAGADLERFLVVGLMVEQADVELS